MKTCKDCIFSKVNSSKEDIDSSHYCSESLGSDGHYTWGTPMFMDIGEDIWYAVSNQMAFSEPVSVKGEPSCYSFKPAQYKLIVAADIGNDNGIFDAGIFPSVEEAINFEDKEFAYKYNAFYGSTIEVVGSKKIVAQSLGEWSKNPNDRNWHCPI